MKQTVRLHGLVSESIVDGTGYRTAVFTQGCPHRCEGCHNPASHDPNGGAAWTLDDVEKKFSGNPLLDGITLTGGEPFEQAAECAELARRAHAKELSVWTYSGYTLEQLLRMASEMDAYTLTDRATYLAQGDDSILLIHVEGDPALFNQYGVIPIADAANAEGAMAFTDWITGEEGQDVIASFTLEGTEDTLFEPNASD